MFQVVCYGDSNTWGYIPGLGTSFDENTRWTGVLQKLLGPDYQVIEEGISARTTAFDDPIRPYLNGCTGLPYSLRSNGPIDLLIISLGTNDLKYGGAVNSARGLTALLNMVVHADAFMNFTTPTQSIFTNAPNILVISPIRLGADLDTKFPDSTVYGKYSESCRFPEAFRPVCDRFHAHFIDASQIAQPSPVDCVHMDETGHLALAEAVCKKVKELLEPDRPVEDR